MLYAQFYHKSAISEALVEACGDRSVYVLDGREKAKTSHDFAASQCKLRGYLAYALFAGETFTRSQRVSNIHRVNGGSK